jgi:predicted ribosome quality control (RQC) complex YloA/Tae2 family protein
VSLTAHHVAELCDELQPLLEGWRVKDVQGFPPRDVLLVLQPPDDREDGDRADEDGPAVLRLRLAADPSAPRLHLQQGRLHRHDGPVGPFFQTLTDELTGATVRSIAPVRGDRMALVELRGDEGRRALLIELFGRRANLLLLGPGDRILAMAAEAPGKAGAEPRLAVGAPWTPPGAGKPPPPSSEGLLDAFPPPDSEPPGKVKDRAPRSWAVECHLGAAAAVAHDEDARRALRQRVRRRIARTEALLKGLEAKASAADGAERVRMDGDLLKSAQGTFKRGDREVVLQDWFTEGTPERRVELDPKLSPAENVQRLFDRFHKLERARGTVDEELRRARARMSELEALAEKAEDRELDAAAVDAEAVAAGLLDPRQVADVRKRKAPPPRKPYRSFLGSKGSEIRVGRSSRDNDTLTIRLARGSDYWLHTADCPGSHVVLCTPKGKEPDHEELLDAAHLAIHFSPIRGTDRAPVHVAQRKHIHKPKGAKPGLVALSGGRILEVRMQQARLDALLRSTGERPNPS